MRDINARAILCTIGSPVLTVARPKGGVHGLGVGGGELDGEHLGVIRIGLYQCPSETTIYTADYMRGIPRSAKYDSWIGRADGYIHRFSCACRFISQPRPGQSAIGAAKEAAAGGDEEVGRVGQIERQATVYNGPAVALAGVVPSDAAIFRKQVATTVIIDEKPVGLRGSHCTSIGNPATIPVGPQ